MKLVLGEREADCRAAPDRDEEIPQPGAVEVGDRARRDVEGERGGLARPVVDEDHALGASEQRANLLRDDCAAAAKDEGDRPADRAARKRRVERVRVRDAAELAVDQPPVRAADRADVDDRLVARVPAAERSYRQRRSERHLAQRRGRPCVLHRHRRCEDVHVGRGADRDRVGRRPGRADAAVPVIVPRVAGRDHRHDAGCGDVANRLDHRVVRRVGLRAAAREVDDVHPVAHRRLERGHDLRRVRGEADPRRDVEHAVVADPGVGSDAREVGDRGMVGPAGRVGPRPPRGDPGDMRAVKRGVAEERQAALAPRAWPRESARDDHLRARPSLPALREPGWVRHPGRRQERMRVVDSVVDDSDLHALAA